MTESAAIVIVGGGCVGASIAFHLAKRGAGRGVILLERETIASGSTGRAVGGIRAQYSTEVNIQFSLESQRFWRAFEAEFGVPIGYHENGYLFLAQTDAERAQFARNVELQNRLGVPSRLLTPADAKALVPAITVDDLTAAAYCPTDGGANPHDATQVYAQRARAGGVDVRTGVSVTGIDVINGRVRGVETTAGRIETRLVVNAAGAWAGQIGALAGVETPVKPYRREIYVSEPFPEIPVGPLVIDLHVGWYFRREGPGILMSGAKDNHSSFDTHVNWADLPRIARVATGRAPALARASFSRAYAGLYDVTPDDHGIIGPAPEVEGFFCACGFSGHGFQHSPATGRVVADLLLDGRATGIDVAPLGLTRFKTGELLREPLTAHAGAIAG